jgi:hypothetical protein
VGAKGSQDGGLADARRNKSAAWGRLTALAAPVEGGLAYEQLVVGQPRAPARFRQDVARFLRRVQPQDCLHKSRPVAGGERRGVEPLGRRPEKPEGFADKALHLSSREPRRQRIDRLHRGGRLAFFGVRHVVGVQHLALAAVDLHPAADQPHLAHRPHSLQHLGLGSEVGDRQEAGCVAEPHPVGRAGIERRQVGVHLRLNGGDLTLHRVGDGDPVAPVDGPRGGDEQDVARQRPARHVGDQLNRILAVPARRRRRRKQRGEVVFGGGRGVCHALLRPR